MESQTIGTQRIKTALCLRSETVSFVKTVHA